MSCFATVQAEVVSLVSLSRWMTGDSRLFPWLGELGTETKHQELQNAASHVGLV